MKTLTDEQEGLFLLWIKTKTGIVDSCVNSIKNSIGEEMFNELRKEYIEHILRGD